MTSTLTQYEFDRLELALQNSKSHWQASPNKRVTQLAFEEIENLRRALPHARDLPGIERQLARALTWYSRFPRSKKARTLGMHYVAVASLNLIHTYEPILQILGRKANVNGQRADE
jgi:hypothetical protein